MDAQSNCTQQYLSVMSCYGKLKTLYIVCYSIDVHSDFLLACIPINNVHGGRISISCFFHLYCPITLVTQILQGNERKSTRNGLLINSNMPLFAEVLFLKRTSSKFKLCVLTELSAHPIYLEKNLCLKLPHSSHLQCRGRVQ